MKDRKIGFVHDTDRQGLGDSYATCEMLRCRVSCGYSMTVAGTVTSDPLGERTEAGILGERVAAVDEADRRVLAQPAAL